LRFPRYSSGQEPLCHLSWAMAPKRTKSGIKGPAPEPGAGLGKFFGAAPKSGAAESPTSAAAQSAAAAPTPELAPTTPSAPTGQHTVSTMNKPKSSATESPTNAAAQSAAAVPAPELAPTAPSAPTGQNLVSPTNAPKSVSALSEEQLRRIEENKRKALERQQLKRGHDGSEKNVRPSPPVQAKDENQSSASPTRTPQKKSTSPRKVTPEKELPRQPQLTSQPRRAGDVGAIGSSCQRPVSATATKFDDSPRGAWKQYHGFYTTRLGLLRDAVLAEARALWSGDVASENFLATVAAYKEPRVGSDIVIVGVLFKDLPERLNIIEEYREKKVLGGLPEDDADAGRKLCSDKDVLWLEDATLRVQLELSCDQVANFATGFVAAVRGRPTSDGKFHTTGACLARVPAPPALPAPVAKPRGKPGPFLALISGLALGAADANLAARELAVNFITGICEEKRRALLASSVQRLIICGGVFGSVDISSGVLAEADALFARIAAKMPVHVLPGRKDPTNLSLPQKPLHPLLFQECRKFQSFKSVTNPFQCALDGLQVIGHSGQPVEDIMRCTQLPTPLKALTTSLEGLHLAPTAPDTLAAQPFTETDPFVVDTVPHVLFSGGHEEEAHEWRAASSGSAGTLCVCVPAFHRLPAVVLVNMQNPRDVRVEQFGSRASEVDACMNDA